MPMPPQCASNPHPPPLEVGDMVEAPAPPKLLYIAVSDSGGRRAFRYTRPVLQGTLQLMGCKARHAFKISKRVFNVMRSEFLDASKSDNTVKEENDPSLVLDKDAETLNPEILEVNGSSIPFELYKTQTTIVVSREKFLSVVCDALSSYKYVGPNQKADFLLACRIKERKESVTVLLCGTSGCGKSTLSSLLGSRLGFTTVVSTDSIRHMMRSFADEKQNPLLYASTYHAGECLDPVAVAQAKAKRKAKKLNIVSPPNTNEGRGDTSELPPRTEMIGSKQMAIEGFKAQSEMVIDSLDRLITSWEEQKQSVIVEGVHLSLNFVMGLMKKHPSIIPFMVYIANEEKHMERFAVRAKYMTLDPAKNRYIKYIRNIRAIQEYLCNRADKHLVPKINNTNVDQSVAAIHATVFSCLRRQESGEQLYDLNANTVAVVDEEYRNQCAANSLGSKGMFQLIQRKGSSRNLMALLNIDGCVTKAWHVDTTSGGNGNLNGSTSSDKSSKNPMFNQISKVEPVNLQFGSFGISAWMSDTGGTSHTGSVDDLRADGIETSGKYHSSCCSSPKMSDCPSKELMEDDYSVFGSEDADDHPDAGTDEDLTDEERYIHEMEAGSVDEHSTKSDEEYDDLAMQDVMENGYCSDDEQAAVSTKNSPNPENIPGAADGGEEGRWHHSLAFFLKMSKEVAATEMPCA
ncbi:hypothetical protein GUJ93_ZPchr0002g25374 [Zizania palustris]|uniref:Uncharacterized protein n=1 Tax=Zizania palustris TaxID=103762 RepID=A0A8J5ST03_ZIZPA|nr:hypothetical protein GUJ93_ZPchr0002g25374 [Zizania palustris]